MSLQLLAKQMEAKGRGGDSVLVHMTHGEVAGLQKLAESAGGSLSVNPETGLVEANFLKRMLPTLVGIGVGAATLNPYAGAAAGAAVGGIQANRSGQNVGMGALMGGLGGYGGANIGAGLSAAGATAAQSGAMGAEAAAQNTAQRMAVENAAAAEGAKLGGMEAAQFSASNPMIQAPSFEPLTAGDAVAQANYQAVRDPSVIESLVETPAQMGTDAGAEAILAKGDAAKQAFYNQNFAAKSGQGLQALSEQGGRDEFMKKVGGGSGLAKNIGYSAVSAAGLEDAPEEKEVPVDDEMYVYDFSYNPTGADRASGESSAEKQYFVPTFSNKRKVKASEYAEGGITAAPSGATSDSMGYLMGNSGASQQGLQYLMGQTNQSPVMQSAIARQNAVSNFVAPERAKSTIDTTEGYKLIDDGQYAGLYQSE
jgi:hypothetical protein